MSLKAFGSTRKFVRSGQYSSANVRGLDAMTPVGCANESVYLIAQAAVCMQHFQDGLPAR
jgi:hypothetical protein